MCMTRMKRKMMTIQRDIVIGSCVLQMVRVTATTKLFLKVENLLMIDLLDYG